MSHPHHVTGAARQDTAPSMSYVPPYRVDAHTFINEQLATAAAQAQVQSLDPTAPPPPLPPPPRSSSTSQASAQPAPTTTISTNPLSIPPPPRKDVSSNAAATAAPPPPCLPATFSSIPSTLPVTFYERPPSPHAPSPAPAPPQVKPPLAPPLQHPPFSAPPTVAAVAITAAPLPPHPSSSNSNAALYSARIPELRVILARGRLSGVTHVAADATGEEIYRAFCPAGDTYPNENASASTAAAAAAATTTTAATTSAATPVMSPSSRGGSHAPRALSEMANALTSDGKAAVAPNGTADTSHRRSGTALTSAMRGRLPPGWERRVFHNTTFYLDHISREAHEQEPWVVWWGRAGNAEASGL
ncbi:hypothetical protein ABB37_04531 [Leptomonas pyrrhocoris]|uniref:WW domain-containing protein n=1 Tax=Leptomonas pyrrhocoris TaxID=157538 RepID=A0A0M9G2Z9_LEPPY|nr:hypothetical protein ABB37_04531 [Leptomonas pyrrhocoris]KPA81193.1 hypothetical protein ABB37_04531 [Leptomonas pyrrhocoris]|eukprot:XP_015659632.1 hypothetical protein ABB37_04531 [Leptomonas pyrrhocoris]